MAHEILHFNGYTIRVVGSGNLIGTFKGFDEIETKLTTALTLAATNARMPTKLSNFNAQRAVLRLETLGDGDWAKVNDLTIWIKPVSTSYPM